MRTESFPEWPSYDPETVDAVTAVLKSGAWGSTHGSVVAEFEADFARYQTARFCTCASSGTMGLDAALRAIGIGPGDEVVLPPYTFIASASSVVHCGAVPVFADIDPTTHLVDLDALERALTPRTKAVMPVHFAGRPVDMSALMTLCRDRGVHVVEDAAQAHGAEWSGDRVGALGDVGMFSFQSSKNMTAGEGGAVVTNDEAIADRVYALVNVGRVRGGGWYQHETLGFNLRMTELQGAVLHVQLANHPRLQAVREANAQLLSRLLAEIDGVEIAPDDDRITKHGRHLLLFRVTGLRTVQRKLAFVEALLAEGIPVSAGYGVGLHRNEPLLRAAEENARRAGRRYEPVDAPATDRAVCETIVAPHNMLLADETAMHDIADAVAKVARTFDV